MKQVPVPVFSVPMFDEMVKGRCNKHRPFFCSYVLRIFERKYGNFTAN